MTQQNYGIQVSDSETPSQVTKNIQNPHINYSNTKQNPNVVDTDSAVVNNNPAPLQSQSSIALQNQTPMYGGGIYDNSMYGMNSMYGNSMYGNSMYGNSMYGMNPMYGNSMYGNNMYGMSPFGMNPYSPMNVMASSVNSVGRFAQYLGGGAQTLHMIFGGVVQFATTAVMMVRDFGGFFSGMYLFRLIRYLIKKVKNLIYFIFRIQPPLDDQMEELFQNVNQTQNQNNSQHSKPSFLSMGFLVFGLLWILQWIFKTIRNELTQRQAREQEMLRQQQQQQQQQQNQVNNGQIVPQQNMYPYNNGMYGQPYNSMGYPQPQPYNTMYGQPYNNMGYPQPQLQQPIQPIQQPTQNNTNTTNTTNNNTNNTSNNTSNQTNIESDFLKSSSDNKERVTN